MRDETEDTDPIEGQGTEALEETLAPVPVMDSDQLLALVASFPAQVSEYLTALVQHPDHTRKALLSELRIPYRRAERWIYGSAFAPAVPGFREAEAAIRANAKGIRAALAAGAIAALAPEAAQRYASILRSEARTDRERQLAYQAAKDILTSTGALRSGSGVTVNVDARSVTSTSAELWQAAGGASAWRDRHRQQKAAGD